MYAVWRLEKANSVGLWQAHAVGRGRARGPEIQQYLSEISRMDEHESLYV